MQTNAQPAVVMVNSSVAMVAFDRFISLASIHPWTRCSRQKESGTATSA